MTSKWVSESAQRSANTDARFALQEFGLAEIPAVSRRSPAGFGFDMDALLDDSDASQSKPERRKHRCHGSYCQHLLTHYAELAIGSATLLAVL